MKMKHNCYRFLPHRFAFRAANPPKEGVIG